MESSNFAKINLVIVMQKLKRKSLINVMLGLLGLVIVFHVFVITKFVPYNIAWGGRLKNDAEMYVFEAISMIVILFLILVLLMKAHYLKMKINENTINIILKCYFALFVLNTIGNFFAKSTFEKSFAVITFIFAVFIFLIGSKKFHDGQKIG